MSLERSLMLMAGIVVMITTLLGIAFPNGYWQYFTIFVGANMAQSVFTGFCPAAIVFKKLGIKTEQEKCQISK